MTNLDAIFILASPTLLLLLVHLYYKEDGSVVLDFHHNQFITH